MKPLDQEVQDCDTEEQVSEVSPVTMEAVSKHPGAGKGA